MKLYGLSETWPHFLAGFRNPCKSLPQDISANVLARMREGGESIASRGALYTLCKKFRIWNRKINMSDVTGCSCLQIFSNMNLFICTVQILQGENLHLRMYSMLKLQFVPCVLQQFIVAICKFHGLFLLQERCSRWSATSAWSTATSRKITKENSPTLCITSILMHSMWKWCVS